MPVSETFRTVVLVFLGTHIPATLMMDSQALLPPAIVPGFMKSLLDFHVRTNSDPLMADPPAWFKSFILFELLFQLPFFFIGFKAFYERRNWIRIPGVVYGAHTATTLIPILAEILHPATVFPDEAARWGCSSYTSPTCSSRPRWRTRWAWTTSPSAPRAGPTSSRYSD